MITPAGGTPTLEARDIAVHYGGVKAVDGVSLSLHRGNIYGLLGPNGSGKTTLLGAVTRLVPLTRGALLLDGAEYQGDHPARLARLGVSRTFQTVRLLPDLNVRQNVALGADVGSRAERRARRLSGMTVADAMSRTGVSSLARSRPGELSYGVQRRVEVARSLAMNPRVLLLDEPTAGMNRHERSDISNLLKQLRGDGITILLVEHDVRMMLDTCDHLFAMHVGSLIAEGPPNEVVRNEMVRDLYLGRRGEQDA